MSDGNRRGIGLSREEVRLLCRGDNVKSPTGNRPTLENTPFHFSKVTDKDVRLNFENSDFRWIHPAEMTKYDIVPGLPEAWRSVNI
jgi:hypothetical protein